jgi:hypothetical protein
VLNNRPSEATGLAPWSVTPYYSNVGGPHIGSAVKDAYQAYLDGRYHDKEGGLAWLDRYIQPRASLVRGDHVLPYFGGKGNKQVGEILNSAWQAQKAGQFADDAAAQAWLASHMNDRSSMAKNNVD